MYDILRFLYKKTHKFTFSVLRFLRLQLGLENYLTEWYFIRRDIR